MHKLETPLSYFRLNNSKTNNPGTYTVTWYVLDIDSVSGEVARCFNDIELRQFQDYINQAPLNYEGPKNYWVCNNDEVPRCGFETALIDKNWSFPKMVILRKTPQKSKPGTISSCMDIVLTDSNGNDSHSYNLEFNVVGEIHV